MTKHPVPESPNEDLNHSDENTRENGVRNENLPSPWKSEIQMSTPPAAEITPTGRSGVVMKHLQKLLKALESFFCSEGKAEPLLIDIMHVDDFKLKKKKGKKKKRKRENKN